ncbi:MAG: hypothetical protein ACM3XN_06700 [Chloroflexota bacterium]
MTRRHMRVVTLVLAVAFLGAFMAGCALRPQLSQQPPVTQQPPATQQPPTTQNPPTEPSATESRQAVLDKANLAVKYLRDKDMKSLADLVHPDKGVRFSPYGYIHGDDKGDLVFTANQLSGLYADPTVYRWGSYDGSGDPIDLTFERYFVRFVYDRDFATAPKIGYDEVIGKGNTLINIDQVYPDAVFVEYHFPGTDPQYGGMDWRSLRLIFENKGGVWYLVGIVHDEWTI